VLVSDLNIESSTTPQPSKTSQTQIPSFYRRHSSPTSHQLRTFTNMSPPTLFKVLIFSKTAGYRHTSIAAGIASIRALGQRQNNVTFSCHASEDAEECFNNATSLSQYSVIVLLHPTGAYLSSSQLTILQAFVRSGGGIVAIHGASAAMYSSPWYTSLMGTLFSNHPEPQEGTVLLEEANADHPVLQGSGCAAKERRGWRDEWYNFTTHPRENGKLKILLRGDPGSFKGGEMGNDHPLAWCQEFEGGRVFYTALGHFEEAYADEWFVGMLERGILWTGRRA
jgi:type 1 glutamine amidotransferase